ncbi:hypothetical protein BDP55DRAFT_124355 [Colletotrichum godetiae]|uniref:Uncharacterized protein n=1 Tax=Colletotrichum godetiae TaxID=1209918 RepID=A0AAJ0EYL5_9PEZI|nr:uncharacterized protein BDP55DRAFT_124355 [Colletotrichum godetiae]KAK1700272.1 hypothetical protein BDP55DRAFT_124355 [Colletotrichum godetiae]
MDGMDQENASCHTIYSIPLSAFWFVRYCIVQSVVFVVWSVLSPATTVRIWLGNRCGVHVTRTLSLSSGMGHDPTAESVYASSRIDAPWQAVLNDGGLNRAMYPTCR